MADQENIPLDNIEDAIEAIRNGEIIIVVDDENRENEGDFVCAAECVTPEVINFMTKEGRGLICAPLVEDRCEALDLDLMVGKNTAKHATPLRFLLTFLVTVVQQEYRLVTGLKLCKPL